MGGVAGARDKVGIRSSSKCRADIDYDLEELII